MAADKEWKKMVTNSVVKPAQAALAEVPEGGLSRRDREVHCAAPMLAVVKDSDIDEALAELAVAGHEADVKEDAPGFIDRLNEALAAQGCGRQVKARLCTDFGRTLNPHLRTCPMAYHPADELLELLRSDSWFCKIDYRRCFYNIPLHRLMYPFMGMMWAGVLWVAVRVLFGISLGPFIACLLTAETASVMRAAGVPCKVYIGDNAVAACSKQRCYELRGTAMGIAGRAGWPFAEEKLEEDKPSQCLSFRGVVFNTILDLLCLHVTRLCSTLRKVRTLLLAPEGFYLSVRLTRSTLGSLEWTCCCVPMGRLHTKPVYADIPRGARNEWVMALSTKSWVHLTWWEDFLVRAIQGGGAHHWAGFDKPMPECPVLRMFSDASGEIGFGAYCAGRVVAGLWAPAPEAVAKFSSSWTQWVPVELMLKLIAPELLPGTIVVVTTDNEANAFATNNGVAGDGSYERLASILSIAAEFRLRVVGDWVSRDRIEVIDLCSRLRPMPGSK